MNGPLRLLLALGAGIAALVVLAPKPRAPRGAPATAAADGWYDGAGGYDAALAESRRSGKPVALYFHTDWCGWCKKMDSEIFAAAETRAYLDGLAKVRIDPEKGSEEAGLARRYGVRGYPTFLIVPAAGGEGRRVHPFTTRGTMSAAEFVSACRTAGG